MNCCHDNVFSVTSAVLRFPGFACCRSGGSLKVLLHGAQHPTLGIQVTISHMYVCTAVTFACFFLVEVNLAKLFCQGFYRILRIGHSLCLGFYRILRIAHSLLSGILPDLTHWPFSLSGILPDLTHCPFSFVRDSTGSYALPILFCQGFYQILCIGHSLLSGILPDLMHCPFSFVRDSTRSYALAILFCQGFYQILCIGHSLLSGILPDLTHLPLSIFPSDLRFVFLLALSSWFLRQVS